MHYSHLICLPSVFALLVATLLPLSRAPLVCILVFCWVVSSRPTLIPIGLSAKLPLTAVKSLSKFIFTNKSTKEIHEKKTKVKNTIRFCLKKYYISL